MSIINAHDQVWRLHRLAFGPSTTFMLRTLQTGNRKGYELQIGNLRFGSLQGRNHWIVFQRIGDEDDGWKVRMRSNLWSEPQGEVTSEDVWFRDLLAPPSSSSSEWFNFPRASFAALRALERAVEGHLQASGNIAITLRADCSWRFTPGSRGRLTILPYGFPLENFTLAWCEPAPPPTKNAGAAKPAPQKEAAASGLEHGLVALAAIDQDAEVALIEQATKEGTAKKETQGPVAQPIFCAAGDIKVGDQRLLFRGDTSFSLLLKYQSERDKPSLTYNYLRGNWDPGVDMPTGIAEIAVKTKTPEEEKKNPARRWSMTAFAGRQVTLGELAIDDALLRVRRRAEGGFEDEFVGFAAPLEMGPQTGSGTLAQSPIGTVQIGNCPIQERTSSRNRTRFQSRHVAGSTASGGPGTLQSCSVPLNLFACSVLLPGADYSQFTFNAAALHAVWYPAGTTLGRILADLESYLWIGSLASVQHLPVMRLDLSRARLAATRNGDLLEVAFLFADLWLEIHKGKVELVPPSSSYRVLRREIPSPSAINRNSMDEREDILDTRPVLVVEFPPQHVFEEAIFKTAASDLPEVTLLKDKTPATEFQVPEISSFPTDPVALVDRLAKCERSKRITVRSELARQKIAQEGSGLFQKLHDRLLAIKGEDRNWENIDDQFIYIGPYGMDPDVRARARRELVQIVKEQYNGRSAKLARFTSRVTDGYFNPGSQTATLLNQANDRAKQLNNPGSYPESDQGIVARLARSLLPSRHDASDTTPNPPLGPADAILHEQAIAALLPGYDLFRDYYREEMTRKWTNDATNKQASGAPEYLEFFSLDNRGWASDEQKTSMKNLQTEMTRKYDLSLAVEPDSKTIMRARLANPSRLAFRLNLEPGKALGFDLTCLLDWQAHELAVSARARAVTPYDQQGRPRLSEDPALKEDSLGADFQKLSQSQQSEGLKREDQKDPNDTSADTEPGTAALSGAVEDVSMLRSLGFHFGATVTAEQRLTDVEASLRSPGLLETAIELPARLILSPSQAAKWRVPWTPVADGPHRLPPVCLRPLWSVELVTESVDPAVRAIYSPDLRPSFVRQTLERAAAAAAKPKNGVSLSVPTGAPPPRGPRAPWTLGIEDGGPKPSSSAEVAKQLGIPFPPPVSCEEAGKGKPDSRSAEETLPSLIRYLRRRERDHNCYKNSAVFRSSLDAYDRHEIVMLSSSYGLPVSGKRDAKGGLLPISISSQAEAPELLQPIDLTPDSALYRPRSLKIRELRLSALGGTLRHDTDFVPPTAAEHLVYGPLHDSLSVERWQHWVVLGRDVFAEVVYKGFLFPIGHRASLVKQTERIFLRAKVQRARGQKDEKPASDPTDGSLNGSVRAYLQQRIFIRIGEPLKAFPALGQPNRGRQFPPRSVLLLTTVTPDLVDPSQDDPGKSKDEDGPNSAGRLLANLPGLVFWPRTARIAGSEVRFEALVDASFVKLPLIFVDNTAAQNAETLCKLTQYYNKLGTPEADYNVRPQDLRTLDLQQQSLRYCDEVKPASASHRTVYWNLKASGGSDAGTQTEATVNNGEGKNTLFHNSALEGADQPSFYPAIESACIRLDQLERMTANKTEPALVQFDGHYLQFGFPSNSTDRSFDQPAAQPSTSISGSKDQQAEEAARQKEADRNHLEIYLNVINDVSFGMGAAGDRSGGVFQPGGGVAALSRMRGPLGGDRQSRERGSIVNAFQERKTAYQNYFTSKSGAGTGILDTKLLGILSLKDVVGFCKQFRPAAEGLPQLQEVLAYGASATGATEQTLRTNIIQPLARAMAELNTQWEKVDRQLSEAQEHNRILAVHLSNIFPELSRAKNDFATALGTTQSLGGVEFLTSLGDVYETGLRLESALEQASTHIPERSFLAVANAFPTFVAEYFDLDLIATVVLKPIVEKVGKQSGSAGLPDIHRATEYLASLALDYDVLVNRFFPGAGGLKASTAEALRNKKQELINALNGVSSMAAVLAAQQFAQALLAEPAFASLAESWASTALPLFEVARALDQAAAAPNDPQKWAAAASIILTQLWPLPEKLRCGESAFVTGVKGILNQLTAITKGVEDTWKAAGNLHPSLYSIQLPPYCKTNRIIGDETKTADDLCSFAAAAREALASVRDSSGRAYLIGAANAALKTEEQVLMLARLLSQMGKGARPQEIVDVSPIFLTSVFDQVQQLMDAVASALKLMLPTLLPALEEVQNSKLQDLAKTLHAGMSFLLRCQSSALQLTEAWVKNWVNATTDVATLAALKQQLHANTPLLERALQTARQTNSWQAWREVDRDTVIPLPDDLFLKLSQQGAQYLKLAWSQALAVERKCRAIS